MAELAEVVEEGRRLQEAGGQCEELDLASLIYGNAADSGEVASTAQDDPDADACGAGPSVAESMDPACMDAESAAALAQAEANACVVNSMISSMAPTDDCDAACMMENLAKTAVAVGDLAASGGNGTITMDSFASAVAAANKPVWGCNNRLASNWNPDATHDDGSCETQLVYGTMDFVVGMNCTVALNVWESYPEIVDIETPYGFTELDGGFTFDTLTLNATSAVYPDEFCVDRSTGQMLNVPLFAPRVSDQADATMEYGEKGAPHRCGCPVTCPTDLSDP